MTTTLSLLFLKINVRLFSQSLTDDLAQFCYIISINCKRHLIDQVLYILNNTLNLIRMEFSLFIILLAVC